MWPKIRPNFVSGLLGAELRKFWAILGSLWVFPRRFVELVAEKKLSKAL